VLLGATAVGLAGYWSTPPLPEPPATLELCRFDPGAHLIGVVSLGWPNNEHVDTPVRPAVELLHVSA
jgi:nitroreductase